MRGSSAMRFINISSIEDISRRFGLEAGQMLRAFLRATRQAYQAQLRLVQSLFGKPIGLNSWQSTSGRTATLLPCCVVATSTMPGAALGAIAGQYLLNTPAYFDAQNDAANSGHNPTTNVERGRNQGIRSLSQGGTSHRSFV